MFRVTWRSQTGVLEQIMIKLFSTEDLQEQDWPPANMGCVPLHFFGLPSLTPLRLIDSDVHHWLHCTSALYWQNPCDGLNSNILSPWSLGNHYGVHLLFTLFPLQISLMQHSRISFQITSHGFSKDLKKYLNEKNAAFRENDFEGFKIKIKKLRAKIQKVKIDFKSKVGDQLANHDARSAWQGLNKMMRRDSKGVNNDIIDRDISKWVNYLNMVIEIRLMKLVPGLLWIHRSAWEVNTLACVLSKSGPVKRQVQTALEAMF